MFVEWIEGVTLVCFYYSIRYTCQRLTLCVSHAYTVVLYVFKVYKK